MKKIRLYILLTLCFLSTQTIFAGEKADIGTKELPKLSSQLWKNAHINFRVKKNDDYRWRNFAIGTGYGHSIESVPDLSWQINMDYNWNKYTLYPTGSYDVPKKTILKTGSLSFPATLEYSIYQNFFTGINVYMGPVYELILFTSTKNQVDLRSEVARSQFGWIVGTRFRFLAIFSLRLSYSYYPTSVFKNGDLNRSAVMFSLGF